MSAVPRVLLPAALLFPTDYRNRTDRTRSLAGVKNTDSLFTVANVEYNQSLAYV